MAERKVEFIAELVAGATGTGGSGVAGFLQGVLQSYEPIWADLASFDKLDPEQEHKLVVAIEREYSGQIENIRKARDRRLAAILQALETAARRT